MRIDAITCCVGEVYAPQLKRSLPIWGDTLDSLIIVTEPNDPILDAQVPSNVKFVVTDVFTQYGAHFNKGAALCEAYAAADPTDWALHVDSDIIPPANWRDTAECHAERGCLSGAFRYDEHTGECLDERPLYPYGYFHLWHTSDPASHLWPLFEPWFPHAGSYDANFTDRWLTKNRRDLGFKLIHQGERRVNWFGPGAPAIHMQKLKRIGLRKVRLLANRTGQGRLKVPTPKVRVAIRHTDTKFINQVLRVCRSGGPFGVEAKVVKTWTPTKYMEIRNAADLEDLQSRIESMQ